MAMLFVILFHVGLPRWSDFYGLRRMGNLGVDMFLFLSGVGLWFSWAKTTLSRTGSLPTREGGGRGFFFHNWFSFYMRRLKRIYPVWLIIACLYYIPRFDGVHWGDLFGDILSDEASMLTGTIGTIGSASLGATSVGMYEPIHGSAPDIAGKDIANPIGTILSVAMMYRYSFQLEQEALDIEKAVDTILSQGYRTVDMMSEGMKQVGCKEMGDLILQAL